jgi:NADPH-dependent glutamate synthase beta subunit-like oxidoreductase/nitroreductase/formate hydrogenlyase subunit 6/NADH:ubiquinone oxidoreductase subunit I
MGKKNETAANKGIMLQKRVYKPSKKQKRVDPVLATYPMGIDLDEDKCIGCGICTLQCAAQVLGMVRREKPSGLQTPACQHACPSGIDVRDYLKLIASGASLDKAWKVITKNNPFPAVTGRVCPHPCETACNRGCLDNPVNINCIERYVGDYGIAKGLSFEKPSKTNGIKVAVVGSGPSGLSCAYQLALMGYSVTIFEASAKLGGMLAYAIPQYRLPEEVVGKEIQRIIDLGIILELNTSIGKDISLDALKKEFKAVYIAIGAQGSTSMGVEGNNVLTGLAFLRAVREGKKPNLGEKVVVVGGGNTAIDAARTARKMGSDVTIIYRRTREEMPAYAAEVEDALEEGVKIQFLSAPVKISSSGRITCQKMKLGEPDESGRPRPVPVTGSEFDVEYSTIIAAIGQELDQAGFDSIEMKGSWIAAGAFGQTSEKKMFAGGDAVSGPGLVTQAIGAGAKAALGIDAFIRGIKVDAPEKLEISFKNVPYMERMHHLYEYKNISRVDAGKLDAGRRRANPDAEVGLPLTENQAANESRRCIQCGTYEAAYVGARDCDYFGSVCVACNTCSAICPQQAILENKSYRIDEGMWATPNDVPVNNLDGLPNPLRLPRPVPLEEIESEITEVEKVIYTRRSCRVYKPDPVPRELIERVLEAGRHSPSAGNCQDYKVIVITDRSLMDEINAAVWKYVSTVPKVFIARTGLAKLIKKLLIPILGKELDQRPAGAIYGFMHPHFGDQELHAFFDAPCAIILVPSQLHISNIELDMGILGQNMVLAAEALGLGTCYVGFSGNTLRAGKVPKEVIKKLGLEWPHDKPSIVIMMGYQAVPMRRAVPRDFPKVKWIE